MLTDDQLQEKLGQAISDSKVLIDQAGKLIETAQALVAEIRRLQAIIAASRDN